MHKLTVIGVDLAKNVMQVSVLCVFHGKSATDSTRNRPPISWQTGHRFHGNPATHSRANRPPHFAVI